MTDLIATEDLWGRTRYRGSVSQISLLGAILVACLGTTAETAGDSRRAELSQCGWGLIHCAAVTGTDFDWYTEDDLHKLTGNTD